MIGEKNRRKIFFKGEENQEISEALRVIRTNLHFLDDKEMGRVILVTSSTPREGKSFIAANYAMSIAITGKKVLLVDCDIRRPRAHESFGKMVDKGLESILLGKNNIKNVILKEVEKNLDILPTKYIKSNVTELFIGDKMKNIIKELKEVYNTIILDTPPLVVASDGAILSQYCDGVVFVVSYDQVSRNELEFSKKMLDNAGANLYGFIVNRVEKNGFSYGNYCYYTNNYNYYKDYYTDENKKENKKNGYFQKVKTVYKREFTGNQKGKS